MALEFVIRKRVLWDRVGRNWKLVVARVASEPAGSLLNPFSY